jgi:membrane fusion protein, adhesin transport system
MASTPNQEQQAFLNALNPNSSTFDALAVEKLLLARDETPASLRMVRTPFSAFWMAFGLFAVLLLIVLGLAFVPWQQSVTGVGEVTVFNPMERPQNLKAQLGGRIKRWLVSEGQWVKQGQTLIELEEVKTDYLDPLQSERLDDKRKAYLAKQEALNRSQTALNAELAATQQGLSFAVPSANRKQSEINNKLEAIYRKVDGAKQAYETAKLNLERRKVLYSEGLRSERDFELAQQDEAKALADWKAAEAEANAATQASEGAGFDVGKTQSDYAGKQADLQGKMAKVSQELAVLSSDLQDLDIKRANIISRRAQLSVKAPVAGRLVNAKVLGAGEIVKEGQSLATVLPTSQDRTVALYINDFDAPLVQTGRHVRLQFSGWPALQFSGWPSVSLGSFAGTVALVDAIDDGSNRYRILVRPDEAAIKQAHEQAWPQAEVLRPGTQALGWIMLDTVPLGYELWRRFNGFPPSLKERSKPKGYYSQIKSATAKGAK